MGVYIKDLHKAKYCIDCPLMMSNADGDWCALQDAETNESFKSWDDMRKHCPLVEVKAPHGRLIDADALGWNDAEKKAHNEVVEVARISGCGSPTHQYYSAYYDGLLTMTSKIRFAPTIIEAIEAEGKDDG